jgi:hypothetical protein
VTRSDQGVVVVLDDALLEFPLRWVLSFWRRPVFVRSGGLHAEEGIMDPAVRSIEQRVV